ncbi:MAG TPA: hypothetical protein PLA85_10915 [Micropepsaceae bacterium]|nr:hypothetical protein [Micropepsaceae bacterium]
MKTIEITIPVGEAVLLIPGDCQEMEGLVGVMAALEASVLTHCDERGKSAFFALSVMFSRARIQDNPRQEFDA